MINKMLDLFNDPRFNHLSMKQKQQLLAYLMHKNN